MGQAVLSDPVTRYREVGADALLMCARSYAGSPPGAKGNRVNILDPAHGDRRRLAGLLFQYMKAKGNPLMTQIGLNLHILWERLTNRIHAWSP